MTHIRVEKADGTGAFYLCRNFRVEVASVPARVVMHFTPDDAEHFGICPSCLRKLRRPAAIVIPREFKSADEPETAS